MTRKLASLPVVATILAAMVACNSSTYQTVEDTASAAVVKSFSLAKDDDVLDGLNNVFFSIDLVKGLIFNADSLPPGTKVTCLQPEITTLEGATRIELTMKRAGKQDTTINYTGSVADTVDFSSPVALKVVSPDGITTRTYTVKVNVHRMAPDSLSWGENVSMPLPTDINTPQFQRSARTASRLYTLTGINGNPDCCLACFDGVDDMGYNYLSEMPLTKRGVTLPFAPRINTFTASTDDENLYLLDTDGRLWASSDGGNSWNMGTQQWTEIIGVYLSSVFGIARGADGSYTIEATGREPMPMPAGFPVSGFSMPHIYSFPMSEYPQMLIVGGRTADGTLSPHTWGFDGSVWARISNASIPVALEGMTIVPYYEYSAKSGITSEQQSALIAFGGRDAAGKLNTVTYVSSDYGFNWRRAGDKLQLPAYIPAMYGAQAFVLDTEIKASDAPASQRMRIVRPIESWTCPYIYLYGGYDEAGQLLPTVWRGVINRLSFKPIV